MPQSKIFESQLRLHFIVFLWGFTAILGELITLEAVPLVGYRIAIAVFFIWLILSIRKIPMKVSPSLLLRLFGAGCVIALHWITFFHSIKISNVSIALICLSASALFVSLIEPVLFRRKIYLNEIVLSIVVTTGIITILSVETQYIEGIIVGLVAAFLSALFSVINGLLVRKESPEVISLYELSGGGLAILIFTITRLGLGYIEPVSLIPQGNDLLYLLILGVVATAYAYTEAVRVMKHLTPFTVVLTINLEPVYGIIMAFLILGSEERMSGGFYIGAAIIIAAVIVNGYQQRKRTKQLSI